MSFYSDWKTAFLHGEDYTVFVKKFLLSDEESLRTLYGGNEDDLQEAYEVLTAVPLEAFFTGIEHLQGLPPFTAADVPCFSTMEKGVSRLNEVLLFHPEGMTFDEIGYQLMESETKAAQKKYGENQSKLAAVMSLVTLENTRPIVVKPTAFGRFLTEYDYVEKKEALKKLALRNSCIMSLLQKAFTGYICYADIVSLLKPSTQRRRGTNVRYLTDFILKGSSRELAFSNINWKV